MEDKRKLPEHIRKIMEDLVRKANTGHPPLCRKCMESMKDGSTIAVCPDTLKEGRCIRCGAKLDKQKKDKKKKKKKDKKKGKR